MSRFALLFVVLTHVYGEEASDADAAPAPVPQSPGGCDGECPMGTYDYIMKKYYKVRAEKGETADTRVQEMMIEALADADAATANTTLRFESEKVQTNAHLLGNVGVHLNDHVFFATFDHDGAIQQYNDATDLQDTLYLGGDGGHFFSSMVAVGTDHLLAGTSGWPATVLLVETKPKLRFVTSLPLNEAWGGVAGMTVDGDRIVVLTGRPPARFVLLSADLTPGSQVLRVLDSMLLEDAATISWQTGFLDARQKLAYAATIDGCLIRVSYANDAFVAVMEPWHRQCIGFARNLFGFTIDPETEQALVIAISPYRQMIIVDLKDGTAKTALPLSQDLQFITNVLRAPAVASETFTRVIVVSQSRRGIPVLMQVHLPHMARGEFDWGLVAGGQCDQYSWTETRRQSKESASVIRYYPPRYYGCAWNPMGRQASGAAIGVGKLWLAVERVRCTICTQEEPVFGGLPYCQREEEEYRQPVAKCAPVAWNQRPRMETQMLSTEQLAVATNQHFGAVNTSLQYFVLGGIPSAGGLHAAFEQSGSQRAESMSLAVLAAALFLPQRGRPLAALLGAAWGAEGKGAITHLHEAECKCFRGCDVFVSDAHDYGECTDEGFQNAKLFSTAVESIGDTDANLCQLLQCVAFCNVYKYSKSSSSSGGGPEQVVDMHGQQVCSGIAKAIGCDVDCGGAVRLCSSPLLGFAIMVAAFLGAA